MSKQINPTSINIKLSLDGASVTTCIVLGVTLSSFSSTSSVIIGSTGGGANVNLNSPVASMLARYFVVPRKTCV